ncbi:MAG: ArsA family ATPase [Oligoflexia bacterium]
MSAPFFNREVIITCGTGGVGKTTLSAALGLRAALEGKRVCVITIDPAKRLATSLGMATLGSEPQDLTALLKEAALKAKIDTQPNGTFHALMPDTRSSFEGFFGALSGNSGVAEALGRNPLFQIFAREFSGTNEYMALQQLQKLHDSGRFDCIILDTPPSRNTLDFLDAPRLLNQLFEANLIQWLVVPANRIAQATVKKALGLLEKLTGASFMHHLLDLAKAIFEVRTGFSKHLSRVIELLESEKTGVLLVTGAHADFAEELSHFRRHLLSHGLKLDALIVNRTLGAYPDLSPAQTSKLTVDPHLSRSLELLQSLRAREKQALDRLKQATGGLPTTLLPELARDVHSIEDLLHVASRL